MPTLLVTVEAEFHSAHQLPGYGGACSRIHGHTYRLAVTLAGEPDAETGMVIDFAELQAMVDEKVVSVLDHRLLNEVVSPPTAENIARWIWERLKADMPQLTEVKVYETSQCYVTYRG